MAFNFDKLLPPRPEGAKRYSHEAKGKVLKDKNGIVFVPFRQDRFGWDCVTLHDPRGVYPPSGYNIVVSNADVETADEIEVEFD